jgi:hypothetical protein
MSPVRRVLKYSIGSDSSRRVRKSSVAESKRTETKLSR